MEGQCDGQRRVQPLRGKGPGTEARLAQCARLIAVQQSVIASQRTEIERLLRQSVPRTSAEEPLRSEQQGREGDVLLSAEEDEDVVRQNGEAVQEEREVARADGEVTRQQGVQAEQEGAEATPAGERQVSLHPAPARVLALVSALTTETNYASQP